MAIFLITFGFFLVIFAAMAVGYIFQRQERDRVAALAVGDINVKNI